LTALRRNAFIWCRSERSRALLSVAPPAIQNGFTNHGNATWSGCPKGRCLGEYVYAAQFSCDWLVSNPSFSSQEIQGIQFEVSFNVPARQMNVHDSLNDNSLRTPTSTVHPCLQLLSPFKISLQNLAFKTLPDIPFKISHISARKSSFSMNSVLGSLSLM
jgi:hypothetical protein